MAYKAHIREAKYMDTTQLNRPIRDSNVASVSLVTHMTLLMAPLPVSVS